MTICALCGSYFVGAHACSTNFAQPVRHGTVFSGPPRNAGFVAEAACVWSRADDETDLWEGSCGVAWSMPDGTPDENGMNYCPRCGAKLEQAKENPDDNQA